MNIWIFNHYAITPDLPGGTRHYDLAQELVKHGHHVTIFASNFNHDQRRYVKLRADKKWGTESFDGVNFVWIRTFPYQRNDWRRVLNMLSFMSRAWRLGRRLPELSSELEGPDVIIGSSVHLLAVLAAYRVAKYYRARFIMEVRDLWPQTIIDMGRLTEKGVLAKSLRFLERYLYRRADKIITLLPHADEYITACGVAKEKVIWLPNGVDLARFSQSPLEGICPDTFKVMYFGRHGPANALDVVLEAAKVVENRGYHSIKFLLVGDGPEKSKLLALAKSMNLKNVEFRDAVPKDLGPKVLQEANAYIFNLESSSVFKYGISSNKLFDYMASMKPVIFSACSSNNPVEESQCGLTVPPRDPETLADAVMRISRMSKEDRKIMGRHGREYVEKHHSMQVLVKRLIHCIEGIM